MNGEFGARHRREPVGASWGRAGPWQETPASATQAPAAAPNGGCRDRTPEFRAVVSQIFGVGVGAASWRRGTAGAVAESRFSLHARQIGADLNRTRAKMEKLALLAQHVGRQQQQRMLPVSAGEFDELAKIVGQDLGGLNQAIASLQESARFGGGLPPTGQSAAHSSAVVLTLQTRLAEMSGRYKDTVQFHQQQQRRQQPDLSMHRSQSDASVIDMSGVSLSSDSAGARGRQQQQQMLVVNDRDLAERDDTMRSIEQTMVDLGSVFQQLATIVKEQDELVHRIGASVDDTALNVEVAHTELLKFFKSLTSNRKLMLKVFGLLLIFFILFVVFLR